MACEEGEVTNQRVTEPITQGLDKEDTQNNLEDLVVSEEHLAVVGHTAEKKSGSVRAANVQGAIAGICYLIEAV